VAFATIAYTMRRPLRRVTTALTVASALATCAVKPPATTSPATTSPATTDPATRTYRMGFSVIPPRDDKALALAAIDLWSRRADAAIINTEPPWTELLAGADPAAHVAANYASLAAYYRSKGHEIWVYLDPGNGLNRAAESDGLVAAHRSITEPAVQELYRRFARAMDTVIQPAHMGTALETNLIRLQSPPALYAAIRKLANDAAADVRAQDPNVRLSVSVQVDVAWGGRATAGPFRGVATDFLDFPFVQELGLSSYPYLSGFTEPEQLPLDYYSRLLEGRSLPVMVTEGGWTSGAVGDVASSPDKQRRYIVRQAQLLDAARAMAVFQLTFTDIDLRAIALPPGSIAPLFAQLGLVDINLGAKPALAAWDETFGRSRR
jgi:hypothetical protein